MRIVASLTVVVAGLIALGFAPGPSGTSACRPKVRTIGGKQAIVFCGPATATVKVGGRTLRFSGGTCTRSARRFTLQLGTLVQGAATNAGLPFLSLGMPASRDGAGRSLGSMLFSWRGVPYVVGGGGRGFAYVLRNNRTRGTFSGTDNKREPVTGSFAC